MKDWLTSENFVARVKKYKLEGDRHTISLTGKEGVINGRITKIGKDFIELSDGKTLASFPLSQIDSIICHFGPVPMAAPTAPSPTRRELLERVING